MTSQTHLRDPRWNPEQSALRDYERDNGGEGDE